MNRKAIPVYLFLGFLEAGKTQFVQKTISDKRFGLSENLLLITCEEGIEEFDLSQFNGKSVKFHTLEDKSELDEQLLYKLSEECSADKIIIEYNGMWHLTDLLRSGYGILLVRFSVQPILQRSGREMGNCNG